MPKTCANDALKLYETSYDVKTEKPSEKVIQIVAALENKRPTELPPLGLSIDTDALDALFRARTKNTAQEIQFVYSGYLVCIWTNGVIAIHHPEQDTAGISD